MTGGAMTDLREFVARGTVTTRMIDNEAVTYPKMSGGDVVDRSSSKPAGTRPTPTSPSPASFQQVVVATFTKPPAWTSYEITVWGSAMLNATIAGRVWFGPAPEGPTTAPNVTSSPGTPPT